MSTTLNISFPSFKRRYGLFSQWIKVFLKHYSPYKTYSNTLTKNYDKYKQNFQKIEHELSLMSKSNNQPYVDIFIVSTIEYFCFRYNQCFLKSFDKAKGRCHFWKEMMISCRHIGQQIFNVHYFWKSNNQPRKVLCMFIHTSFGEKIPVLSLNRLIGT